MFRYPGGKSKLKVKILEKIREKNGAERYCEPFFGGGSIGLELLSEIKEIWINDKDVGIACLWTSVIRYPEDFKKLINAYKPKVEDFYKFKEELLNITDDCLETGFKKLVIHQISYSGLGVKSGGPLGGKEQNSKYKIDCRWSPKYICQKIDKIHNQFKNVKIFENSCTCLDFSVLIKDNYSSFFYIDPPYYVKGNELYQYGFTIKDHQRLALALKYTKHKWLLSYDNCEEIRNFYEWAEIEEIQNNYTINNSSGFKTELLINPG